MQWILLIVLVVLLPEILSTVLDSRLGRAMAARLESGSGTADDEGSTERIRHLEGEVDRLGEKVRRLEEESDFLQKLLTERSGAADPTSPPGRLPGSGTAE
ncbi:MAG: hypothetical protein EA352_04385 [Gemmatimonadales bacterium]|nr:MAG: hypothetical protein EA352_04385 [Gemmatimonadales bacterium]